MLKPEQLEALVAPIALYPDELLANVLAAATYPLEVVQADRWTKSNKSLKGDALKIAVDKQQWDDSVKALASTPDVLAMMSDKIDWTKNLGDAVLAQQPDVMDAIQRLRAKAQANNKLVTNKQQKVSVQKQDNRDVIVIQQANPETMYVRLRGYWVSHDSGRLINPTIVEGQIQGAVALGIGSALFEEIRYDTTGQPLSASYMDYAVPRSDDIPPLEIDHLETPSPLNPLGLKGVGESGTLPVPAVVASALEDALSERAIRVERMPLTPEKLWQLVRPERHWG